MLNIRLPIKRLIHRFILRFFIFRHQILNLKELNNPVLARDDGNPI